MHVLGFFFFYIFCLFFITVNVRFAKRCNRPFYHVQYCCVWSPKLFILVSFFIWFVCDCKMCLFETVKFSSNTLQNCFACVLWAPVGSGRGTPPPPPGPRGDATSIFTLLHLFKPRSKNQGHKSPKTTNTQSRKQCADVNTWFMMWKLWTEKVINKKQIKPSLLNASWFITQQSIPLFIQNKTYRACCFVCFSTLLPNPL